MVRKDGRLDGEAEAEHGKTRFQCDEVKNCAPLQKKVDKQYFFGVSSGEDQEGGIQGGRNDRATFPCHVIHVTECYKVCISVSVYDLPILNRGEKTGLTFLHLTFSNASFMSLYMGKMNTVCSLSLLCLQSTV